jgi:drug/metabolite transporter (DMT)-like permease
MSSLAAYAATLSPNMRGALWMLVSVVGATAMTVLVRALTPDLHTTMIVFLRSAVGLAFIAHMLGRADPVRLTRLRRPWLHLARGALTAVALNMGFFALWTLPLTTATILFFMAPVFSTMLAPLMLGERVGVWRWGAVLAGFAGALIVTRPGLSDIELGALAAVGSSLSFALALLVGKIAASRDGSDAVFVTTGLLSAALTLPPALPHWSLPTDATVWALVLALSAVSALRGYADIRSLAVGEASFVAPISYLRLPAVALAAWLLFAETVDGATWVGGGVIAAATLVITLRERRARPTAPPPIETSPPAP